MVVKAVERIDLFVKSFLSSLSFFSFGETFANDLLSIETFVNAFPRQSSRDCSDPKNFHI